MKNIFLKYFLNILAKICPQLDAPAVKVWDAFAEYTKSGTRFGHCIFSDVAHSSSEIEIEWDARIFEACSPFPAYVWEL